MMAPELYLDFGTMTLQDGTNMTGDFSITFPEDTILSFYPVDSKMTFS
jgi:hypothetical protein